VAPGDTITVTVRVKEKRAEKHIIILETSCANQTGKEVLAGTATVIAPTNKIEWPRSALPKVGLRRQDRYEAFVKRARSLPPLRAAIVNPCSAEAILGAIEVQREGLLDPLLIGPEEKIRAASEQAQVSLEGIPIEPAAHSHAAAARAVAVAGKVSLLVKGSLQGIRVNALSPGPLKTRAASAIDHFDKVIDEARSRAPERRLVTIEDVGAMAAGLVSDFARNVTGSIAYVDAGYHVMS
jgi:NAD(P)-dependent dehydrogenase (short-subunit alcohol dehydrogenase family)